MVGPGDMAHGRNSFPAAEIGVSRWRISGLSYRHRPPRSAEEIEQKSVSSGRSAVMGRDQSSARDAFSLEVLPPGAALSTIIGSYERDMNRLCASFAVMTSPSIMRRPV